MAFDDHDIFKFSQLQLNNVPKNVLSELRGQSNLVDTTNRTWSIALYSCNVSFPYQFNFAQSLINFQLIVKWLKVLHKKKTSGGEDEGVVPPDLIIACKVYRIF